VIISSARTKKIKEKHLDTVIKLAFGPVIACVDLGNYNFHLKSTSVDFFEHPEGVFSFTPIHSLCTFSFSQETDEQN
jgi:hypothetical protein